MSSFQNEALSRQIALDGPSLRPQSGPDPEMGAGGRVCRRSGSLRRPSPNYDDQIAGLRAEITKLNRRIQNSTSNAAQDAEEETNSPPPTAVNGCAHRACAGENGDHPMKAAKRPAEK